MKYIYLSHIIDNDTPTYGSEYTIDIKLVHSIEKGSIANESSIYSTTHIGTHIDLPYHFYKDGKTIESYAASYWIYNNPLCINISPNSAIVCDEVISALEQKSNIKDIDLLIVNTDIGKIRKEKIYMTNNFGFSPKLYNYLTKKFLKLRAFGFDSISLSSYQNPMIGRKAHKVFLNPNKPLLIIEDMNLLDLKPNDNLTQVIISPMRIANCDGMPCSIIAKIEGDKNDK